MLLSYSDYQPYAQTIDLFQSHIIAHKECQYLRPHRPFLSLMVPPTHANVDMKQLSPCCTRWHVWFFRKCEQDILHHISCNESEYRDGV